VSSASSCADSVSPLLDTSSCTAGRSDGSSALSEGEDGDGEQSEEEDEEDEGDLFAQSYQGGKHGEEE
jgi:hypothetical protein